ncbi:MAG: hypothetical protein QOF51_2097 [Chloroflexota bacterium]|nr:hypothetical protein [Chloroflexota bacterium]
MTRFQVLLGLVVLAAIGLSIMAVQGGGGEALGATIRLWVAIVALTIVGVLAMRAGKSG